MPILPLELRRLAAVAAGLLPLLAATAAGQPADTAPVPCPAPLVAQVLACAPAEAGDLEALVSVQVGLLRRAAEAPIQLRYRMRRGPGGTWQIADIHYPGEPGFRLSSYLAELLQPPSDGYLRS